MSNEMRVTTIESQWPEDIHEARGEYIELKQEIRNLERAVRYEGKADTAPLIRAKQTRLEGLRQFIADQAEGRAGRALSAEEIADEGLYDVDVMHAQKRERLTPPAHMNTGIQGGSGIGAAIVRAGWSLRDQPRVEIPVHELRNFPAVVDQSPRVIEGINPLGRDERFLWNRLPSQDIGADTSVNDFRQTNREVDGDVERALDQTDEKASLALSIEHVTAEVRQLAVMIEDIPNVVLESLATAQEFFNSEATYQLNAELDKHVYDRIVASDPPSGSDGDNIIEQVRNAISAKRLAGSVPSMLVLNPTDAAQLDLFTQPGSGDYAYDRSQVGGAAPLWGLQVVERTSETGDEAPMLIDPQRLGLVYTGVMAFLANPYLKANQNLTDLRFEMRALAHIRRADAAYIIDDSNGNGNGNG